MKKKVFLPLLALLAVLCTACSPKTALTADEFMEQMTAKGFETYDVTEQSSLDTVQSVSLAVKDNTYQIEFYVLDGEDMAAGLFAGNQERFESEAGNVSSHSSVSASNYARYTQTTGENYYVVSRIDNTVLYCVVAKDYKDEVESAVKELGYL